MPLRWELDKVKDYETVCFEERIDPETKETKNVMKPITEALLWSFMGVGLGEITEKNASEFALRVRMRERVHGAMLKTADEKSYFLTERDVRAHIGMKVNVYPVPMSQFKKNLINQVEADARNELAMEAKESENSQPSG